MLALRIIVPKISVQTPYPERAITSIEKLATVTAKNWIMPSALNLTVLLRMLYGTSATPPIMNRTEIDCVMGITLGSLKSQAVG